MDSYIHALKLLVPTNVQMHWNTDCLEFGYPLRLSTSSGEVEGTPLTKVWVVG